MQAFELADVGARRRTAGPEYLPFLRVPALHIGLYLLPTGSEDPQQPHAEDEVYHVVEGRAVFRLGDEDRSVGPGAVLYAPAGVAHRFHTITEDLRVLVFFSTAPPAAPVAGA